MTSARKQPHGAASLPSLPYVSVAMKGYRRQKEVGGGGRFPGLENPHCTFVNSPSDDHYAFNLRESPCSSV